MVIFLFLRVVLSPCRRVAMSPNQGNTNCRNVVNPNLDRRNPPPHKIIILFCPNIRLSQKYFVSLRRNI